ncbi:MAG: hypothetical protein HY547_07795, partial [Elusimicrobia bacterium]|nr:hypothetical protein [Elusimicrobiota bacterium]
PAAFTSFLLASPWASLPTTILLLRLFGSRGAVIILAAIFISMTTGLGISLLAQKGWVPANPHATLSMTQESWRALIKRNYHDISNFSGFAAKFQKACLGLLGMTFPWVALGVLISAAAGSYLSHWIHGYMGQGFWGPLASLAAATAVEVCSEGSSPVAFEIYKNTAALGSAFVFLEAGIITDFTELSLVAANAGKRTALALAALSVPQALAIAYILNLA